MIDICWLIPHPHSSTLNQCLDWHSINTQLTVSQWSVHAQLNGMSAIISQISTKMLRKDSIDQVSIRSQFRIGTRLQMPLEHKIQIFTNYTPGLHNQIITKHDLTLWGRFYPSLMMLQLLQLIAASDSVKHKRYNVHVHFNNYFPFILKIEISVVLVTD